MNERVDDMLLRLSGKKKQEYEQLCHVIQELTQEMDRLREEQRDLTEANNRLEVAVNNCFEFVRHEIYNK